MTKLTLGLALLVYGAAVRAELCFEGYMTSGGPSRFVVSLDRGRSSDWLVIGEKFEGFTIVAFNEDVLTVEKDGGRRYLRLVGATGGPSSPADEPTLKPINIMIGGNRVISCRAGAPGFDHLKKELVNAAALIPQPVVTIEGGVVPSEFIRSILKLSSEAGIRNVRVWPAKGPKTNIRDGR